MAARPRVVIIGAGFAGLEVARGLRNSDVEITIIDKKNHHCFQPLLYQVATAALSPADIAWPVRSLLSDQPNVRTIMSEVTSIDRTNRVVAAGAHTYPYDFLVIASGATHSYFGHADWADKAPGLKTVEDATLIRSRILKQFELAELEHDAARRAALLTFIVIGGGPTGVELAGAIAEVSKTILAYDFRLLSPRSAQVHLVEAGPRLLPSFPEDLSDYAASALERLGVVIHLNEAVQDIQAFGITTSKGSIDAGCVLWAAGVRASPGAEWLSADADRAGRVVVNERLELPNAASVFAIGDVATIAGRPIPGIAPAAKQMGRYVARSIIARMAGREIPPFEYRHQGDLATIGRRLAVVRIGRVKLKGFAAWLTWCVGHVFFLITARSRVVVSINWLWEYVTLQRGARLINRE
jgi:NADH:ubiquinone reductase (H+-translocating)